MSPNEACCRPELFRPLEVFAGEALLAEVEHICCYVLRLGERGNHWSYGWGTFQYAIFDEFWVNLNGGNKNRGITWDNQLRKFPIFFVSEHGFL